MPKQFTVEAYTGSGELKYRWNAECIAHEESLYVLHGAWNRLLEQADGTQVPVTNESLEFYWPKECYTISALFNKSGSLQEFYARALIESPQVDDSDCKIMLKLLGSDMQVEPSLKYDVIAVDDSQVTESGDSDGWLDLFLVLERREGPFDAQFLNAHIQKAAIGSR